MERPGLAVALLIGGGGSGGTRTDRGQRPVAHRPDGTALRHLRTLFHIGPTGDMTDGQLLERFVEGRGEAAELAFAAIVERHGPLVLRACRAVLRDDHDAHDAFQATFLVLSRKARSLWVRDSIGPWLLAVARRAARCARAARERRREVEREAPAADRLLIAAAGPGAEAPDPDLGLDLAEILHAEIDRLPGRHRDPVVLCDLQGMTLEQAARRLGCPVGTVKSRLSRARGRLRDRLRRRGMAPEGRPGAAIVALGGPRVLVPPPLSRSTIGLAMQAASKGGAAGLSIPAAVALIAQGASSAMIHAKIAQMVIPSIVLALAAGAGWEASGSGRLPAGPPPLDGPEAQAEGGGAGGVLLLEVGPGTPAVSVSARGNLEATEVIEIRSPIDVPTTLVSIVPEGTRVESGDFVCELDSAPLLDRLEWLEHSNIRNRGILSAERNRMGLAEIKLEEYLEADYPNQLKAVEGEITLARSELERAQDRMGWSDKMLELGYISTAQNLGDKTDLEKARFNLEQAERKREVLEDYSKPRRVKELQAAIDEARIQVLELEESLKGSEEAERLVRTQIERCSVFAPGKGMVVYASESSPGGKAVVIEEGAEVEGGQLIARIIDLDRPMRVVVQAPESHVDRLKPGQRARVRVDAFPGRTFDGKVIEVSPRPDPEIFSRQGVKVYLTPVELDEPSPMLRPGMTAEARIRVSEPTDAIRIPSKAVLRHDGKAYAAVRRPGGGFEWREVAIAPAPGRPYVEVEGGVRPGDLLVVDPIALLRRGSEAGPGGR